MLDLISGSLSSLQTSPVTQQKQAAASSHCGWRSLKSTTNWCTTCCSHHSAPSPRNGRRFVCATTALGTLTSKVGNHQPMTLTLTLRQTDRVVFPDLKWVNVQSLAEACRILQHGNKNRSAAATKMNQSSSRRQVPFSSTLTKSVLTLRKFTPPSLAATAFSP